MKFGRVEHPELIDFTLPEDHPDTARVLSQNKIDKPLDVFVGCAKWNRADLKGFYPRGTKDELQYYSSQFNCIEMNATFYRIFPVEQFEKWYDKTPSNFRFFPKLNQEISHWKRLSGVDEVVNHYLNNASHLKDKIGSFFLQMHTNFAPKDFDRVVDFVENWDTNFPLAVEFRHTDWYNTDIAEKLYELLEKNNMSNILVDSAGRRDIMHMRLTNPTAFVRYVGANHDSDYSRLDDWIDRIEQWQQLGLQQLHFFIHQNIEVESPLLASYFIKKMNKRLGTQLKIPNEEQAPEQQSLF